MRRFLLCQIRLDLKPAEDGSENQVELHVRHPKERISKRTESRGISIIILTYSEAGHRLLPLPNMLSAFSIWTSPCGFVCHRWGRNSLGFGKILGSIWAYIVEVVIEVYKRRSVVVYAGPWAPTFAGTS